MALRIRGIVSTHLLAMLTMLESSGAWRTERVYPLRWPIALRSVAVLWSWRWISLLLTIALLITLLLAVALIVSLRRILVVGIGHSDCMN